MSGVMQRVVLHLAVLGMCLSACAAPTQPTPLPAPERTAYVLSGYNVGAGFARNALSLVDVARWQVLRRVELPHSWAKNFARDPDGRIWLGFSGNNQASDTRVDVYSASGDLLATLHPCTDPEAGISFAAGRAFVACAENGFHGKLAVIRLDTLAIERIIDLSVPDSHLLLTASAATDAAVLVAGSTEGPAEGRYSLVTLLDAYTLDIRAQLQLGVNSDIWRIVTGAGNFYLLNVASWRQPRQQANDVFVLEPTDPIHVRSIAVAASPLWGTLDDDVLYAYHNPTWNQPNGDPARRLSRLDLSTGHVQQWPLPDNWNANDVSVIDGQIMLARWSGRSGQDDGLYSLDSASGELVKQLVVIDASGLIAPASPRR